MHLLRYDVETVHSKAYINMFENIYIKFLCYFFSEIELSLKSCLQDEADISNLNILEQPKNPFTQSSVKLIKID